MREATAGMTADPLVFQELGEDLGAGCRSAFCIGGISVELIASRFSDVALGASLEPFRTEPDISDIHIQIEWAPEIVPTLRRQVFDSGYSWRLYEGEVEFQFDFYVPALGRQPYKRLILDRHFCKGRLLMRESSFAGRARRLSPLAYPLDELLIMHRLSREKAIELHACGIVMADGTGNLFVGHSGAGKSTMTRLWTEPEGFEVLSDDRIIVRRESAGPMGCADGIGTFPRREWSAFPAAHFAQDDKKDEVRMYGTPWHGEAMYASPDSAILSRIFILEHGHGNVVTQLGPSRAVAELFARSFVPFHRHEYVDSSLEFLQNLVDAVPVYHFGFEPDQRAVDTILNFHD